MPADQSGDGSQRIEVQRLSSRSASVSERHLAKVDGSPVAWGLVKTDGSVEYLSYPTWFKSTTEARLNDAFEYLESRLEPDEEGAQPEVAA